MATSSADKSAGGKNFIISHMNADHQDSLALYLRVYCGVSSGQAKYAQLEDISLSDLVITAKGTRYSVPINPPMNTFSDARSRVVAMHKECLQRLGFSDIIIKEYSPPQGLQIVGFALCLASLIGFSRGSNFLPGSILYETCGLAKYPSFTQFCYKVQPIVFGLLFGIHILEATTLAIKRLRPHGVPFLSGLWFAWVITNLIEGFPVWQRFDKLVKVERAKREHRK